MKGSNVASRTALRCLWIGRYIPYPLNEGAKVYSAKLAEALARAGAFVRVLGYGDALAAPGDFDRIEWVGVPGERRSAAAAFFSRLPLSAAVDSTAAYATLLESELRESWDAIVLDSYGAGWALDRCKAYCESRGPRRTVLVHVSHNHEEALWRSMTMQANASPPRRLALWRNYRKVCALERRLITESDLVTAITAEDASAFAEHCADREALVLTPGYDGPIAGPRLIDARTPRRVAIVGSFHWVVKRENLKRFIEHADPVFAQRGVELVVAGHMPGDLLQELSSRCRATRFHGFAPDITDLLSRARVALVPELIGGGFKLKFLDYFFGRTPVAAISAAAAGLPPELRRELLIRPQIPDLTAAIVEHIDRFDELNRMQNAAFELANSLFRWQDRGLRLLERIAGLQEQFSTGRAIDAHAVRACGSIKSRSSLC